jgi:two-component system, cell cycle response regulator DivK
MRDRERAALERLTRFGGTQLMTELVAVYLEDTPKRITTAYNALRSRDTVALAKAAHSIKSSSAQLGAEELAAACELAEDAADDGDLAEASARLLDIEDEFEAFKDWLASQVPDPRGARSEARNGALRPEGTAPPRIAVVEDNVDNRLLIDAILGDGYVLDEYATGADALAEMATRRPDLVLLDVSLPGMDGLDVLARMRADPVLRSVPVVAVTAHAMAGDRERYLAAGFDGYVPKPIVDECVLIDAVERLLPDVRTSRGGGRASRGEPRP